MTQCSWLGDNPVAHRGYHDMNKTIWENTLSAFGRAVEAGFAIECDLQYASDGVPVVFHDDTLKRLCFIEGDVRSRTSTELGMLSVGGTGDKIPTLQQLLTLCAGAVPLVIELKGREGDDDGFAQAVLDALTGYKGKVALMSFDHWLLQDLKELECPYPVGLTAEGNNREAFETHERAMHMGLDFISYFYGDLPNPFIDAQRSHSIPVITWTVRDQAACDHSFAQADQITFEGFDPRSLA